MTDEIVIEEADIEEVEDALPAVTVNTDSHPANLFGAHTPEAVLEQATAQAKVLKDVIVKQGLSSNIQGREHVNVEGWTTLGSMLGVFPIVEWTRETADGWEARVVAKTLDGREVGAAEAMCTRSERTWAKRDDYALRSMAQTRATSKALRLPLGFVMQLAGYSPTPAEEMTFTRDEKPLEPGETRTSVTHFQKLMDGVARQSDGSWPRICPACQGAVEQQTRESKKKPGQTYTMWKCRNRDCQGGDPKPRGDGNWPWGSFHDDPWQVGGEIDDMIDEATVTKTEHGFDAAAALKAGLSNLSQWDDDRKRDAVSAAMKDHGFKNPMSQEQVVEVLATVANVYYAEHPDEEPF